MHTPGAKDLELTAGPAVAVVSRDILRFTKRKDGPRITLSTATFEGRLRVTDPDALRSALLGGIGPAKGYGQSVVRTALRELDRDQGHRGATTRPENISGSHAEGGDGPPSPGTARPGEHSHPKEAGNDEYS